MATLTGIVEQLERLIDKRNQEQAERLYPVGIVVESYALFDPAVQFGIGQWERLTDGRVLVAASDGYVGQEGGSDTVTFTPEGTIEGTAITVEQMPSHTHTQASCDTQGAHTHNRGTQNITGTAGWHAWADTPSGALLKNGGNQRAGAKSDSGAWGSNVKLNAASNWSGATDSKGGHSHTITLNDAGSGQTHDHAFTGAETTINVCQKWRGVYRWRRIS